MTEPVGNLRANLTADWADFRSELQRSGDAVGNFARGFQQAAGRIARDAIGIFGGLQLGQFVNDSIRAAQEAQETAGAFRAAFGDQADAAEDWSARTHDALRLTEAELQTIATRFQNLFGAIAPTNEAAAEASERFTELARDFAELKNISVDQAVQQISSALAGSTRAMRQYGIDISETTVRQEALARGVITATQELSAEQATLIRASILMRELGDATGETARQSGDAEAEAQRLQQRYNETSEELGNALLPAMTALKGGLADILEGFTNAARGIGQFIAQSDPLLARAYQIREAFRGNFIPIEVANEGVRRFRASANEAAPAIGALGDEIRGTTGETEAFAASLAEQAGQLEAGGTRRGGGRSWLERHENDLRRIMEGYDSVGAALREYNEDVEIARRGGLDMAQAQRALAMQFIENVGSVKLLNGALADLPEPIRALAEELLPKLAQEAGTAEDRFRAFAQSINERFDTDSAVRGELAQIQRALDEGLITLETYIRAKNELLGGDPNAGLLPDTSADEERFRVVEERIGSIREGLADLATGTREFGDVWKQVVLEFLRSQWIEPFLERMVRLVNGSSGTKGGSGGGLLGGAGGIIGSIFSSVFGGKRAGGGSVVAGMAYEVGERGRELFVPDQDGEIVPHGQYGRSGVTMNIYTPDANSFRASSRQIAREQRRKIGAQ